MAYTNIIGYFPSYKVGQVTFTSTIERDFLFYLDFAVNVTSFKSQPFTVRELDVDGKYHDYSPDFEVTRKMMRPLIVEIKPHEEIDDEHTQRQIRLGTRWAEKHDYDFEIITDKMLREGCKLKNLRILWRYRLEPVQAPIIDTCRTLLRSSNTLCLRDLAVSLSHSDELWYLQAPYLYCLLFHHILVTDLTNPLRADNNVWLNMEA